MAVPRNSDDAIHPGGAEQRVLERGADVRHVSIGTGQASFPDGRPVQRRDLPVVPFVFVDARGRG